MAAHGMAQDRLPAVVDGKLRRHHRRQFLGDIAPHPIVAGKRLLRGVDVEAGAQSEIVGAGGVAGHAFTTRTGVRGDEDQAELGAGPAKLALFRHVGMGAGQSRKIPHHRQLAVPRAWRDVDRKGHRCTGGGARVLVNPLRPAMGTVRGNRFNRGNRTAPFSRRGTMGQAIGQRRRLGSGVGESSQSGLAGSSRRYGQAFRISPAFKSCLAGLLRHRFQLG